MTTRLRLAAFTIAIDDGALVERPAPGAAPTAFRIWSAGENRTDDESIFFTRRSAQLLMEEQAARGRVYSSDFDHLSLLPNRPAESGRASGWHRLAVRPNADGEPELWAVEIEWCADAKEGLEEQPPKWRFFSPAFRTNKEGEVVSYTNFALCINPLTHQLPSLASETTPIEGTKMNKKAALAAFAKLMASDASEEDKKEAQAKLAEYLEGLDDGDGDEGKKDEKKADDDGDEGAPAEKKAEGGEGAPAEKKADGCEEKTEAKAAAAMADELVATKKRLDALEIEQLLDKRKDLPETVRKWCATQTVDVVKSYLGIAPRATAPRSERATQGDQQHAASVGLQGREKEELDRAMGIRTAVTKPYERLEDGRFRINTMRPSEWTRLSRANAQEGR